MEFAAAALTAISATGAAAAGTAASAAGAVGAAGAAGAASTFSFASLIPSIGTAASILSGGATALSVLGTMRAGEQRARSLELAAADAEIDADISDIETSHRRTSLKRALVQAIGERDVAAAASGADLSFGTPAIARREAAEDADRALEAEDSAGDLRRQRLLERSASYRRMAVESRSGGLARAAAIGLEGGAKIARRG
jgi:hypothetical protein